MNGPVAIPTIDELISDPAKVAAMPPDVARSYLVAVTVLQPLLMAQSSKESKLSPPDDVLVGVEDVAHLIGMSISWVEKHTEALPTRYSVEGNPRWRESEVVAWQKTRPLYGQAG